MKSFKVASGIGLALLIARVAVSAEIDIGHGRVALTINDHNKVVDTPKDMIVRAIDVPADERIKSMHTGTRICEAPKCRVQVLINTDKGHVYRLVTTVASGPIGWGIETRVKIEDALTRAYEAAQKAGISDDPYGVL